jgi:uncharacterized protein
VAVSTASLAAFLAHPARPDGTLTYHELQGFLFTVASAPDLVRPSEWLPIIFNEHEASYATLEEAQAILGHIMTLYNDINAAVMEKRPSLPADCDVRVRALENLDDTAPLAQWARGFLMGHEWLEESWEVELPEDWEGELGAVLMALSFFASRNLAQAFHAETGGPGRSLEDMAESMLRVLPDALGEYAQLGRSVIPAVTGGEMGAPKPRRVVKTGRNEPCPCGSGKKFKKCCGETTH